MNVLQMRIGRVVLSMVVGPLALLMAGGSGSQAITFEPSNLQLEGGVEFAPRSLHRLRFTPGALRLSNGISTLDGSHAPALKELIWEFDRNVRLDLSGIPVCRRPRLAGPRPEESCGDTIVGRGRMEVEILFEESHSIRDVSRLILYNSGEREGVPTLFARAYITKPVASSIILPIRLEPIHSGRFRTAMVATVPKIAGGAGSITGLGMRLSRNVVDHGDLAGFVSLRCVDRRIVARTKLTFSDGTRLEGSIPRPCVAR
jgi:hypothetical protein